MTEIDPLPIRPALREGESITGYLLRLLKYNFFGSSNNFIEDLEMTQSQLLNNDFSQKALTRLANYIKKDESFFLKLNNPLLNLIKKNQFVNKIVNYKPVKYCPECIRKYYYHHFEWYVFPLVMCIRHEVMLQESCPNCQCLIVIKSFIGGFCCSCGYPFAKTPALPIENKKLLNYQKALYQHFNGSPIHLGKECAFEDFIRLAYASFHLLSDGPDFVEVIKHPLTIFHNFLNRTRNSFNMAVAFANVIWMYTDFPNNFHRVLESFLQRNSKMHRYGRLKHLEVLFDDPAFKWVYDAYQIYFLEKLEIGEVRKDFSIFKREPSLLLHRKTLRREEVKGLTSLTYDRIQRLNLRSELLLGQTSKENRVQYHVSTASLQQYLEIGSQLLSNKEVAVLMGVHPSTIKKLIDSGVINTQNEGGASKVISRVEIEALLEKCLGSVISSLPEASRSFHEVLNKYSVNCFSAAQLIHFTIKGTLHPVRLVEAKKMSNNYYLENEIQLCLKEIKNEQVQQRGVSFKDLMKSLHIGEKRLWEILRQNNIIPDITLINRDGRKRYFFKENTINKIIDLVSLADERKLGKGSVT